MNYRLIYDRLMDRAKSRAKSGYMERHHILPSCLGGSNETSNLVWLTPEEHYVAHQLLIKIHPANHRLLWAVTCMTGSSHRQARKNKLYGWLRRAFAQRVGKANRGRKHAGQALENIRKAREQSRGKKLPKYRPRTAPSPLKGRPKSAEHIAKMAAAKVGVKRGPHSEIHKQRLSASIKVAMQGLERPGMNTEEYRQGQAERMRLIWAKRRSGELPTPLVGRRVA